MSVELKVPEVGESITEVYIGEWHKSEGDTVEQDEELVELESEKATFDAPSPATGILKKILKQPGDTADVGEVIAVIDDENADAPPKEESKRSQSEQDEALADVDEQQPDEPDSEDRSKQRQARQRPDAVVEEQHRVMPAARRALAEHGLQAEDVEASGPGGRLLKEDVLRHVDQWESQQRVSSRKTAAASDRRDERVQMNPIRRRIAERLVQAQQTAALLTTFNEIDMSAVKELRRQHGEAFREKHGIKLGYMSFFVKAVIDALKQCPQLNAEVQGHEIIFRHHFDIGVAIGTEKGLVVPVVRNAETLSFAEVEQQIDDLSGQARDGKLKVGQLQGGTFTISNGGIYGSLLSTPIVNPPQSGVLGMHAIQERPVVVQGKIDIRPMMYVALTYDHRIVDGREAVTFLRRVKEAVEQPARMLIEV